MHNIGPLLENNNLLIADQSKANQKINLKLPELDFLEEYVEKEKTSEEIKRYQTKWMRIIPAKDSFEFPGQVCSKVFFLTEKLSKSLTKACVSMQILFQQILVH